MSEKSGFSRFFLLRIEGFFMANGEGILRHRSVKHKTSIYQSVSDVVMI
jgi:hypothetical protein